MPNRSLTLIDAEAAQFHVMARQLRARADEDRLGPAPDFDGVVGDETVAADDQIERALALADAALARRSARRGRGCPSARRACIVRSASESSSIDVSFAIAVGVGDRRPQQRQPARSASTASSGGGVKPPVISTHGKSSVKRQPQRASRAVGSRLSR